MDLCFAPCVPCSEMEREKQLPLQKLWTASDLTVLLMKTRRDETVVLGKVYNTVGDLFLTIFAYLFIYIFIILSS